MKTIVLIVYESANGEKAFPLAKVLSHDVLLAAARSAIDEKRSEARSMAALDSVIGTVAAEEAARLERTLVSLIPGFGLVTDQCSTRAM
jgi:hypothetical protein